MKKALQILNILSVLIAIWTSYYVNAQEDGSSMKDISGKYDNLLTPAGYAFSIWGLVYLGLILFSVFQLADFFTKKVNTDFVKEIGGWFILANLANAAWVIAFTNDHVGLSMIIMCLIFFALLKIVLNLNLERWDAPFITIAMIWWPVSLYFGWINVALIANASAYLTSLGWDGSPLSEDIWAYIVLTIAAIVFITMIWKRNMREYATVGVWGIAAIGVKNLNVNSGVAYFAFSVAAVIVLNTAAHGYKNKDMGPIRRFRPIKNNGETA